MLFPGFFTSSSTESATQVQQAAPPLRSFAGSETSRDFLGEPRPAAAAAAAPSGTQCRKMPGGTRAPCGRSTSCSRQPSPTTVCLPRSQCATRLPAPTRAPRPTRDAIKHEPTPTPGAAPHTPSAPTLGIRDVPGGSIFSTSQVPSAMPALGAGNAASTSSSRAQCCSSSGIVPTCTKRDGTSGSASRGRPRIVCANNSRARRSLVSASRSFCETSAEEVSAPERMDATWSVRPK